jgi:hypothetical protein
MASRKYTRSRSAQTPDGQAAEDCSVCPRIEQFRDTLFSSARDNGVPTAQTCRLIWHWQVRGLARRLQTKS